MIGVDGKLAVAAVDQDAEFHASRPAHVYQGVESGARRPAGVENVIHQNHVLGLDRKRRCLLVDHGLGVHGRQVVPVERDVERRHRGRHFFDLPDLPRQTFRQRDSTPANAHEHQPLGAVVPFDDLIGKAQERAVDLRGRHQLSFFANPCLRASVFPCWSIFHRDPRAL